MRTDILPICERRWKVPDGSLVPLTGAQVEHWEGIHSSGPVTFHSWKVACGDQMENLCRTRNGPPCIEKSSLFLIKL